MITVTEGKCYNCGKPGEVLCDSCEAAAQEKNAKLAEEEAKKLLARRERCWAKVCEGYEDVVPHKMPMALRELYETWEGNKPTSMTIVGKSGAGKTSAAFCFARKAHLACKKVAYWHASNLRQAAIKASTNSQQWFEDFLHSITQADLLIFDDFGQVANTESSAEHLLSILKEIRHKRVPCIVTTQYTGKRIVEGYNDPEAGQAIYRRIGKDYATIINLYEND